MSELLTFIKEVGFPIGIAVYLIIVLNKSITENTKAIQTLTAMVERLTVNK